LRTIDAADAADVQRIANERAALAELLRGYGVTDRAALAELRDGALQAEAVARQTFKLAQTARDEAADLDVRLTTLEPLARALDALHAALGDGKFKRFVAARKEQRLLGVATTILGRMTDERYGFGPAMRIVDRSAGQERSPQTLSGGEKFLASLALAFALVEIAARGGGHFGALFLDEGFGSLDLRALDQALSELERQAAGGRMIGVITHVREVSEYIDDVLRVWRTPAGSDVARLGRADLDALVAETATLAIGNA
jgi:exonuclease SbcC